MKGQPVPGSRQRRTLRTAALVLVGALTLGACGGATEGSDSGSDAIAAVIDGQEVTVGEVQRSSRELSQVIAAQAEGSGQPAQEFGPDKLMTSLVQVPAILDFAQANDLSVPSGAQVEKQLTDIVHSPSPTTIDFFRANIAYSQMSPQQQEQLAAEVAEQDIVVSPRYRNDSPNWFAEPAEMPVEMP